MEPDMTNRHDTGPGRREAARRVRDAFPPMGVYAVRDRRTGHVRVAASRNVHAAINRIRFELRLGSHPDRALQAEWRDGGEARFSFEVLALVKERGEAGFDYGAELRLLEELHRSEHAREGGAP
jgi:hypothetical protein